MPADEGRGSILQGAGDLIFKLVCERSTPEQWAEWLRAPLEHAAGTANHYLVRKLLRAGADGSAGWNGCHGKTLVHAAAEGGSGQVMSALFRAGAGADKNARTPDTGRTPLHLAALAGKEAAAKALVMARADVNILDVKGDAPLHLAIEHGHVGIAQDLLISGANHDVRGSKGEYPIHLAAHHGQDEIVLSLVQSEVDLDSLNAKERTALSIAVLEDRVSTVEALLAGGADASFQMGGYLESALHLAAWEDKTASAPALIEAGANIEARNTTGCTPLYYAVVMGWGASVLTLLHLGANVNSQTNDEATSLHGACRHEQADAADLLLRWGADETIVDYNGKTPSQVIPDIPWASEHRRRALERLTKLLAHAPQDRAWRRRGFVVLCRAHPDRMRLAVEIPDNAAEAVGNQPQEERPSRRARRGRVKVEVQVRGAHGAGGGGSSGSGNAHRTDRMGGGEGAGGVFDGLAAWLVAVTDEDVFRKIVGFL